MRDFTANITVQYEWNRTSPIKENILNMLGIFLTGMMIMGVSLNGFVLHVFRVNKDLLTPLNVLIIAITVLNLIGCITELPWIIHSSFEHRYLFIIIFYF